MTGEAIGAIEQMLLEELRRTREGNDKVLEAVGKLDKALALVTQEQEHSAVKISELNATVSSMSARIDELEKWKAQHAGERSTLGWIINSPIVGWVVAAAAFIWWKLNPSPN